MFFVILFRSCAAGTCVLSVTVSPLVAKKNARPAAFDFAQGSSLSLHYGFKNCQSAVLKVWLIRSATGPVLHFFHNHSCHPCIAFPLLQMAASGPVSAIRDYWDYWNANGGKCAHFLF